MVAQEKIEAVIVTEVDENSAKKSFGEIQKLARDTGKELDQNTVIKFETDLAELRIARDEARKLLKETRQGFEEGLIDKQQVVEAQRAFDRLSSQTTEANRRLQNYRNTGDASLSRLQAKFNDVTDEIKQSRDELIKLGRNTEKIDDIEKQFEQLNKQLKEGKIDMSQYAKEVKQLQGELANAGRQTNSFKDKVIELGKQLGVLAIFASIGNSLKNTLIGLEGGFKQLENQTDLSEKELSNLKDTLVDLDNTGLIGIQEGTKLISTLAKETKESNDQLKDTAIGVAAIAKTFEKDYNEVLRANTALQKTYGLSGKEANDLIVAGLQNTGDTYDDLLDSINEYSAKTADSGVAVEDFIGTLIKGTRLGIRNTDELADVQREFAIRLQDGSKASQEALSKLGIEFADLEKQINNGEITVGQAMSQIALAIKGVENQTVQNQIATDLLGTKYEDNGKIIIDSLINVQDELGNVTNKTAELVENNITGTTAIAKGWKTFSNALLEDLIPLLKNVGNLIGNILVIAGKGVDVLAEIIKLAGSSIETFVAGIGTSIVGLIEVALNGIKTLANTASKIIGKGEIFSINTNLTEKSLIELNKRGQKTSQIFGNLSNSVGNLFSTKELVGFGNQIGKTNKSLQSVNKTTEEGTKLIKNQGNEANKTINSILEGNSKIADQEKELTKQRDEEIKAEADRIERFNRFREIKANEVLKAEENRQKRRGEIFQKAQSLVEAEIKSTEDLISQLKDARQEIEDINQSIQDAERDTATSIAERAVEIQKELDLLKEKSDITGEDYEKRIALEKELQLAKENTNAEDLKEAERQDSLSITEKILEEATAEKLRLENKKLSLLEELNIQKQADESALDALDKKLASEEKLFKKLTDSKIHLEQQFTKTLKEETQKQDVIFDKLENRLQRVIRLQREAGLASSNAVSTSTGFTTGQQNAGGSANTTNNNSNVTINQTNNINAKSTGVQEISNELISATNQANKGIPS